MMMNLTRLQSEVSAGTYKFARPLTIVACATQEKYVVYISCSQCPKGLQPHKQGYYCPLHKWQRAPVYRCNLRVLLQDWIGTEIWVSLFNEVAAKLLGFAANSYVAMTSDEDRSAALSVLRGTRVMATIKKTHKHQLRQLQRVRAGSTRRSILFVEGRQRECRRRRQHCQQHRRR